MPRGGKRPGAGRPRLPDDQRKPPVVTSGPSGPHRRPTEEETREARALLLQAAGAVGLLLFPGTPEARPAVGAWTVIAERAGLARSARGWLATAWKGSRPLGPRTAQSLRDLVEAQEKIKNLHRAP